MSLAYEAEDSDRALRAHGSTAPNPAEEVVDFATTSLGLRYGVSDRLNLTMALPYHQIVSSKVQGEFYTRQNTGIGDLVVTADAMVWSQPQISLELGVKFATGSVDETDQFGQRICDILSLGSGTTDFLVGTNMWVPHFAGLTGLDFNGGLRLRFSGGTNKWGYEFGDQTSFRMHWSYSLTETVRTGMRFNGYHAGKDTWFGNVVPERGATFVYAEPTLSWNVREDFGLGGFVRIPVYMDLVGAQMVAPYTLGFEVTTNLTEALGALVSPLGLGE